MAILLAPTPIEFEDWRSGPFTVDRCEEVVAPVEAPYRPLCRSYWIRDKRIYKLASNKHGIWAANPPKRSERKGIARGLGFLDPHWAPRAVEYDREHPAPRIQRVLGRRVGPTEIFIASGPFFRTAHFEAWLEKHAKEYDADFFFTISPTESEASTRLLTRFGKPFLELNVPRNLASSWLPEKVGAQLRQSKAIVRAIQKAQTRNLK